MHITIVIVTGLALAVSATPFARPAPHQSRAAPVARYADAESQPGFEHVLIHRGLVSKAARSCVDTLIKMAAGHGAFDVYKYCNEQHPGGGPKQPAEQPAKEPTKVPTKEPTKDSSQEPTKEPPRELPGGNPVQSANDKKQGIKNTEVNNSHHVNINADNVIKKDRRWVILRD